MDQHSLDVLSQVYAHFGFIVVITDQQHCLQVGRVFPRGTACLDHELVPVPFRVAALATEQEYRQQLEFIWSDDSAIRSLDLTDYHFYRVETD